MGLFTRKSIAALRAEAEAGTLRRALSALNLATLGVGAIIGAGIFVLTGQAAAQYAGPAIVLSFVLAGVACAFAGLCYAELASMIPIAGSAYTYAYATMGELIAWIIGWDLILEYSLGAATVSVGWSGYVVSFLRDIGVQIPALLSAAPGTCVHEFVRHAAELHECAVAAGDVNALFNLPAALIVLAVSALLVLGIRESARANTIIVVIKVAVILLFIAFGIGYINPENLTPFIPEATGARGEFGLSGVLRGAGVIFFAYIGFDAVSTAAQEAKNPQKDMPVGIMASLVVCTILYIAVAIVLTGIVPYPQLNVADPIAVGIDATGLTWLQPLVKLGAIAGLSSVILVMLLAQPRIFYTMSKDGLLPPLFAKIHPEYRTPWLTTLLTGAVVAVAGGLFPISILGELVSIGTLLAFVIVCAGVLVLRYTQPDIDRPFRTPGMPLVPVLGVGVCLYLMYGLPWHTWERLLIWLALGLAIYFLWGMRSAQRQRARTAKPDDEPPVAPLSR